MQMHFLSKEIENFIFGKLNLKNTKNTKKDGFGVNRLCSSEDLNNWINVAAEKAKQLKFVTHAVKYTHSDAKGTSVNIKTAPLDFNLDLKRNYTHATSKCVVQFLKIVINSRSQTIRNFWQRDVKKVGYTLSKLIRSFEKSIISCVFIHDFP